MIELITTTLVLLFLIFLFIIWANKTTIDKVLKYIMFLLIILEVYLLFKQIGI
jgi:hypothetical protein